MRREPGNALHTRVREGEARKLEHSRAARRADERRDAQQDHAPRPIEDLRVLFRSREGLEVVLTRHRESGRVAVSLRRTRSRSGFVERFTVYADEAEAVYEALASAVPDIAANDDVSPRRRA